MTKRRASRRKPTGDNRSLGQSLANDRDRARVRHKKAAAAAQKADQFETIAFAIDNNKKNKTIESITAETSLDEFLARAELAGTEFTADRQNIEIISATSNTLVVTPCRHEMSTNELIELQKRHESTLRIPRRPKRDEWETAEELTKLENERFLEWRRDLANLQQTEGVVLTPFERNLELWRQLWRVVEKSDIVVQIVDARNPLLFRSIDLERYVNESGPGKQNLLLVNKADFLTETQLAHWRRYFIANKIDAVFWSAIEMPEIDVPKEEEHLQSMTIVDDANSDIAPESNQPQVHDDDDDESWESASSDNDQDESNVHKDDEIKVPFIRAPDELLALFRRRARFNTTTMGRKLVVGMIGYPNVGKSSTINRLIGTKKVSVSATPGKTRHLQTIDVDDQLMLCDCPGLVMPSLTFDSSDMLLNGILSVDHMRDCFGPIARLATRIPRRQLESFYTLMLPKPADHESPNRPPFAHELLTSLAFMRGFMSTNGVPDCSRAARLIIKDVINGRLKLVAVPPDMQQCDFDEHESNDDGDNDDDKGAVALQMMESRRLIDSKRTRGTEVDRQFFATNAAVFHVRSATPTESGDKKHHNRNKKEKLKRIYSDLNG